ncbi:cytochrome c oxidase assembly factor CtaG [Lederbergia sp. NSJ-179]|uniref:cytochrome c oxidase assembly factor CtaG n=1 Tax=Lederbergia sp. NSJ-179 TaxID=2931402 RepID=UPI001FD43DE8|nr:cytochrome c oxidase assembly factor CtaG [Lederbergia sp. NSJ-179]MCJ7843258.1 cytochrome c oxidase assembly factor CtaG [Lederbergia sp. NSJ-179]
MPLSIFGFQALWSPYFLAFVLCVIAGYFYITVRQRRNAPDREALKPKQAILFVLSMLLLYVIKGSPVDLMAHIMFTYHMVQMAFLLLVIPPILIVSIPNWIWKQVIEFHGFRPFFRFMTKPLIALIFFNGVFSMYHVPVVLDGVKMNFLLHGGYTILLFILALFLWWPLVNKLQGEHQLHGLKKVGYILGNGFMLLPACGMIIFAPTAMYATYTNGDMWLKAMELCVPSSTLSGLSTSGFGPELFTNVAPRVDQQLGGVIMKVVQEIVLGYMLVKVFFAWYEKEQKEGEEINKAALLHHNPHAE